MENLIAVKTTKRFKEDIFVDVSDESCLSFGFRHGDVVECPCKLDAIISGVAPGNDGTDVLWYSLIHPAIKGRVCYWGGGKNLRAEGFKLKSA